MKRNILLIAALLMVCNYLFACQAPKRLKTAEQASPADVKRNAKEEWIRDQATVYAVIQMRTPIIKPIARIVSDYIPQKLAIVDKVEKDHFNHPDLRIQLFNSVMHNSTDKVRRLIEAGVGVNFVYGGVTPVMAAWSFPMVTLLVEAGADVNVQSSDGHTALTKKMLLTPLQYIGSLKMIETLLKNGANPYITFKGHGAIAFKILMQWAHKKSANNSLFLNSSQIEHIKSLLENAPCAIPMTPAQVELFNATEKEVIAREQAKLMR